MRPPRVLPLLVAIALIAAAACSGGSSSKTATPVASTPPTGAVSSDGASSSSNPATIREDTGLSAVDIVKKLAPSVVRVQTEGATIDIFGRAAPTGGVGSGTILDTDGHIVTNPVPGWLPAPPAQVQRVVTLLTRVEGAAVSSFGGSAAVAGRGWQDPRAPRSILLIALVRVSAKGVGASAMDRELVTGAGVAADTFCEGATAKPPVSQNPVASIPDSHHAFCGPAPNGTTPSAVTFAKANVLAVLFNVTLSADRLDAIATAQYAALPAADLSVSSGSRGSKSTVLIIAIVVLVVAAAAGAGLAIAARRRHKSRQVESDLGVGPAEGADLVGEPGREMPPAGMYPDPTGTGRARYWTGREWGPKDPSI